MRVISAMTGNPPQLSFPAKFHENLNYLSGADFGRPIAVMVTKTIENRRVLEILTVTIKLIKLPVQFQH